MQAILLLGLFCTALAAPDRSQRIVGGTDTDIQDFPFVVSLQWAFQGWYWSQRCGGALISTTSVLTAAHCVYGDHYSEWRVRVGSTMRSDGGSVHYLVKIINHPDFSFDHLNNDVAVLHLATPAILSHYVKIARIAGADYNLLEGSAAVAMGWGATMYEGFTADTLQSVVTNVINQELCAARYEYLETTPEFKSVPNVTTQMWCSGILNVGGKDSCSGDSGGPVVQQGDIVVGIVSWSYQCADAFYPGVNARVSALSDWIVENA